MAWSMAVVGVSAEEEVVVACCASARSRARKMARRRRVSEGSSRLGPAAEVEIDACVGVLSLDCVDEAVRSNGYVRSVLNNRLAEDLVKDSEVDAPPPW